MTETRTPPRRRTLPAGHVILAVIIGLGAATVLNAQSLERTAIRQANEQGETLRERLAVDLIAPVASATNLLGLDWPRNELDEALGKRQGAGFENAAPEDLPDPTTSTGAPGEPTTTTTLPPPTPVSPQEPLRLWVGGDSLAGEFSNVLTRFAADTGAIETNRASSEVRVSTGLARPDVFNWPGHLAQATPDFDADVTVLMFGLNDDQNMQLPGGGSVSFGTAEWVTEYRRRVGGLMDQQIADGQIVVWLGVPPISDPKRSKRYDLIDTIYEEEAAKRPEVVYVDTGDIITNEKGNYADVIGDGAGGAVRVRTPDGIHLETGGAEFVAASTLRRLEAYFDWTSWRSTTTTAPTTTESPEARQARRENP